MRKVYSVLLVAVLTLMFTAPVFAQKIPDALTPDLVLVNGKIITVDKDFSFAEAVAVKDGKVVAVGTQKEIEAMKGSKTQVLDLQGNTVLPGINDNHTHFTESMMVMPPYAVDLTYPAVKNIEDIRQKLKAAAEALPEGAWILGNGWNQGYIDELVKDLDRTLTKYDFDDVTPKNPIYLIDYSGHCAVVNSRTLELAGITKDTPNPTGGIVNKDPKTGEPNGYIQEKAFGLIEKVKPAYTREQVKQAVLDNVKHWSALGVTSITSAAESPFVVNLYSELAARGDFPMRISALLLWAEYGGLGGTLGDFQKAMQYVGTTTGVGNGRFRIAGVKMFSDGIPPTQTAWTYDAYPDGTFGSLVTEGKDDEERLQNIVEMIKFCHDQGFQIAVHACGDRAMAETVNAFVAAQKANPWDARHYTVHGDWIPKDTMKLMAEYNIGHSTQTAIKYDIADDMTRRVGEERSGDQWPLRDLLDAGVKVANSSDAPVVQPDWRVGLQASILRESKGSGNVSGPHQRLTLEEGIRTYTTYPAWMDHMEDVKGSIEPGKFADFCIIGKDITAIDPHEIMDIPILMTIMDGKVVYTNDSLAIK